jgi:glycosyltransferase involved in cell wall biosynthesis
MPGRVFATLDPFLESGEVMGRSQAGEGFLRALLAVDPFEAYHFFLPDPASAQRQARVLAEEFPALASQGKFHCAHRLALPAALAQGGQQVFHLSDCLTHAAALARLRNLYAPDIFPITGATHSLSYARYPAQFLAQLWPGCCARDRIIATSQAAARAVEELHSGLRQGFGLDPARFPGPGVERIPLGVDAAAIAPATAAERAEARAGLGLGAEERLVLIFGRLSHDSKMDLLPALRALSRLLAGGLRPETLRLGLAGWTLEGDGYLDTVLGLAANLGIRCLAKARPSETDKRGLLHAADIFLSPVDNVQETFGLTLLEAGAAGLPCVASDYSGYRDILAHGQTGLLVPTLGPDSTTDLDPLAPLCFDNHIHLLLAQRTVVDVAALAEALGRLLADPGLCERMGRAARQRVEREFTWAGVAARHLELWERLWAEPVDREALRRAGHPLEPAYGRVFGHYPSSNLAPEMTVRWTRSGEALARGREHLALYAPLEGRILPQALRGLLVLARNPAPAGDLLARVQAELGLDPDQARENFMYCLKNDLLELVRGQ